MTMTKSAFQKMFHDTVKKGFANIEFVGVDGKIRRRKATHDVSLMGDDGETVGTPERNPEITKYFDIGKDAWRCFRTENIRSVNGTKITIE